jgi:hypothetical protein
VISGEGLEGGPRAYPVNSYLIYEFTFGLAFYLYRYTVFLLRNAMSLLERAGQLSQEDFDAIPIMYTIHLHIAQEGKELKLSDLADARSSDGEKRKAVAEHIRTACLTAGFFYGTADTSLGRSGHKLTDSEESRCARAGSGTYLRQ